MKNDLKMILMTMLTIAIASKNVFLVDQDYSITTQKLKACQATPPISLSLMKTQIMRKHNITITSNTNVVLDVVNNMVTNDIKLTSTTNKVKSNNGFQDFNPNSYKFSSSKDLEKFTLIYDNTYFNLFKVGTFQNTLKWIGRDVIFAGPLIQIEESKLENFTLKFEKNIYGDTGCLNISFKQPCKIFPNNVQVEIKWENYKFSDIGYNFNIFPEICSLDLNGKKPTSTTTRCYTSGGNTLFLENLFINDVNKSDYTLKICNVKTGAIVGNVEMNFYHQKYDKTLLFLKGTAKADVYLPPLKPTFLDDNKLFAGYPFVTVFILKSERPFMTDDSIDLVFSFIQKLTYIKNMKIEIKDLRSGVDQIFKINLENSNEFKVDITGNLYWDTGVYFKLSSDQLIDPSLTGEVSLQIRHNHSKGYLFENPQILSYTILNNDMLEDKVTTKTSASALSNDITFRFSSKEFNVLNTTSSNISYSFGKYAYLDKTLPITVWINHGKYSNFTFLEKENILTVYNINLQSLKDMQMKITGLKNSNFNTNPTSIKVTVLNNNNLPSYEKNFSMQLAKPEFKITSVSSYYENSYIVMSVKFSYSEPIYGDHFFRAVVPPNLNIDHSDCIFDSNFPVDYGTICESYTIEGNDNNFIKIRNLFKNTDSKNEYELQLKFGTNDLIKGKGSFIQIGAFGVSELESNLHQLDSIYSLVKDAKYEFDLGCPRFCNICDIINKCVVCKNGFELSLGKCLPPVFN